MEKRRLKIFDLDGNFIDSILIINNDSKLPSLRLIFDGFDSGIISDEYIFVALQKLHSILDTKNIKLLCYGCRYDVHPSGMSLDMGGGVKSYKLVMGQRARIADLVDIFDPTDEVDKIKSVEVQDLYYEEWLKR